jgi:hypothetical protein
MYDLAQSAVEFQEHLINNSILFALDMSDLLQKLTIKIRMISLFSVIKLDIDSSKQYFGSILTLDRNSKLFIQ